MKIERKTHGTTERTEIRLIPCRNLSYSIKMLFWKCRHFDTTFSRKHKCSAFHSLNNFSVLNINIYSPWNVNNRIFCRRRCRYIFVLTITNIYIWIENETFYGWYTQSTVGMQNSRKQTNGEKKERKFESLNWIHDLKIFPNLRTP